MKQYKTTVTFRLDPALKQLLRKLARQEKRTLSAYVEQVLTKTAWYQKRQKEEAANG